MRHLLAFVVACHSAKPPVSEPTSPELTSALAPLSWCLGDWRAHDRDQTWVAASGAMYGVTLMRGSFAILSIDDGDGPTADGVLRAFAMPDGKETVETKVVAGPSSFTAGDTYKRDGDTLHAGALTLARGTREAAPELEAADRAFAADVAKRRVEGWLAAFDPKGAMMRRGKRVEYAQIRETMESTLSKGKLEWAPIASGKRGDLGFTVGKATYTGEDSWRSTYVTIWRKQADSSWKVLFDTGRPVQKPAQ
jgi:ketosteroid isomerase-like protein